MGMEHVLRIFGWLGVCQGCCGLGPLWGRTRSGWLPACGDFPSGVDGWDTGQIPGLPAGLRAVRPDGAGKFTRLVGFWGSVRTRRAHPDKLKARAP